MTKAIGIDLGTTFSAVAIMEAGKPAIINNAEGQRITASVVAFDKQRGLLVGEPARRQAVSNPEKTVYSIKRKMGSDYKVKIDDKEYTPEQISAMILQKLKKDAEAYLGQKVERAVITCPAYFTDAQRQATKDAGKIAGLEVLRIINEPTAAALAYGLDKSNAHTIMVYDLGGGTFDVSILELGDGVFEVKSTAGNNMLGGDDFDKRLMDYFMDEFKKNEGIDLSKDKVALQRLKDEAERVKIELSSTQSATANLPFISATSSGPKHLNIEVTRAKFESMIKDLVEGTVKHMEQAMADAKLLPRDIDQAILVGGSTRIPMVQQIVKRVMGQEPNKSVNPDEAVALGAAIQAGVITGEVKDLLLLDVTPLSLGIETLGGRFTKLIDRNTTIPTKKSQIFSTAADNQTAVDINVLQGERALAQDNVSLGRFTLQGIPPAPRGIPQVEVTFDIDVNGIVNVSAKDLATSKVQDIKIQSNKLKENDVKRMREESKKFEEEDRKKLEEIDTRNKADSLVYTVEKTVKDMKDKLSSDKLNELNKKNSELQEALKKKEITEIKNKMNELEQILHRIMSEVYQQAQSQYQSQQGNQQQNQNQNGKAKKKSKMGEGAVDAEFEEADKDKQ